MTGHWRRDAPARHIGREPTRVPGVTKSRTKAATFYVFVLSFMHDIYIITNIKTNYKINFILINTYSTYTFLKSVGRTGREVHNKCPAWQSSYLDQKHGTE